MPLCLFQYTEAQRKSFLVCSNITRCLAHLDEFDTIAIGDSRHHILASVLFQSSNFYCFDHRENIADYRVSMLINQEFNHAHNIDEIIRRVFESGLFVKWHSDHRRIKTTSSIEFGSPSVTVEQISAAFVFIILGGWTLATLTFIAEHIIFRNYRREGASCIWMYLERFFDGQRHYMKNLPERLQCNAGGTQEGNVAKREDLEEG